MTTHASNYVETSILNVYLRGLSFVTACPVYIALYTISPSDSSNGTEVELSGTTLYHRMSASGADGNTIYNTSITADSSPSLWGNEIIPPPPSTNFTVSNGEASNNFQIDFPARGAGAWGTVTHFAIVSGSWLGASGSNIYFYGPLETSFTDPPTQSIISFPVNSIKVALQGNFTKYIANNVLNHYLNRYIPNIPGQNIKVGLFTTLPDRDGLNGVEVPQYLQDGTLTGYSRISGGGVNLWTSPGEYRTLTSASTTSDLVFTNSALTDWGPIRGAGIIDGIRNQLLFIAPFVNKQIAVDATSGSVVKQVLMGDSFKLAKGCFRVTVN